MGLLSNGGGGSLASADCPHGLVGNDDGGPGGDRLLDGVELLLEDVIGLTGLALLKRLTNAEDGLKTGGLGASNLLSDDLVGLTEELSALGVANKGPLEAEVDDLLGTDLASVCTVALGADVLGGDEDVGVEHRLGGGDVQADGGDDDLDAALVELHGVEGVRAHVANEVNGAIALPVATNDVLSLGSCFDHLNLSIFVCL
mmetsp:Transcript_34608/g.45513  ORF Transcript_34608/g.45513 Transcript_34608/m.45513 type:complete len:201 (-) Transcript_34608:2-604(-)